MTCVLNYVLLFLPLHYCHTLEYTMLPEDSSVLSIPDQKWHFFVKSYRAFLHGNITTSTPVLRACAVYQVAEIYYYKGQPRTELLFLFPHVKGEHLVNLTLNNNKLYVNRKFYVKVKYVLPDDKTRVYLHKNKKMSRVWAISETGIETSIGNGNLTTPKIPWVYHSVPNPVPSRTNGRTSYPCSEVKIKVVDGYVEYIVEWAEMGFPSEPYGDTFFTTTTTTTATTATTQSKGHTNFGTTPSETASNKASLTTGLIFAVGGIVMLAATGTLFFVGFRLGRWYAKRAALKQRLQ